MLDSVTSDPAVADTHTTLVFSRWRGVGPVPAVEPEDERRAER